MQDQADAGEEAEDSRVQPAVGIRDEADQVPPAPSSGASR
jgi:hypothetical protein